MTVALIDAFMPLSIPLVNSASNNTELTNHIIRQKALSDFLAGKMSALDYLNILETTGVDVDSYMDQVIPVLREGMRCDLFVMS